MTKTAKSFYEKYNGKAIDYDKTYGVQCVDGARLWQDYFLGASIPCAGNYASGYWTGNRSWFKSKGCTEITDPSKLQNGDLVIWPYGSASHPSSHVAMYYEGMEFGQNQGDNRQFRLKSTTFSDMAGAFRSSNCDPGTSNTLSSTSNSGEAVDQILHVGSHVKFPSRMKVTKINKAKNWAYVPDLGGYISAKPLDEVDASDGKKDQILHAGSVVTIAGTFTVTAVNKSTNCVKLKAYSGATSNWTFDFWIKAKPLTEVK